MILLGTPFRTSPGETFSFARSDTNSQWPRIAAEIRAQIPVMLQNRLVPPPRETLSLNRYVCILRQVQRRRVQDADVVGAVIVGS